MLLFLRWETRVYMLKARSKIEEIAHISIMVELVVINDAKTSIAVATHMTAIDAFLALPYFIPKSPRISVQSHKSITAIKPARHKPTSLSSYAAARKIGTEGT